MQPVGAGGGTLGLVGGERDHVGVRVVGDAGERHGGAGGVAGNVSAAVRVAGLDPHVVVDVESRVRPGEHGVGGFGRQELAPHERGEDGAAEGLGQDGGIVER
jgi:hypothetical protein